MKKRIILSVVAVSALFFFIERDVFAWKDTPDKGFTHIMPLNADTGEVRYTSGSTVYLEGLVANRWVGRYWSADSRINTAGEALDEAAFQIEINHKPLTTNWTFISSKEQIDSDKDCREYVVELSNTEQPIKVKIHTLLDGTPVLTRWLEITNKSEQSIALTALSVWSGQLWPGDAYSYRERSSIDPEPFTLERLPGRVPFTLGYFTKQDWAYEGWFKWEDMKPGITTVTRDWVRSSANPFFIVRNDAVGEYFIGHLAWPTNWKMEFDRSSLGLSFKIGPSSDAALRVIAAGETIQTPAMHLGHISGDFDTAVQAMHNHLRQSVLLPPPSERFGLVQYLVPGDQGYYIPLDESSAFKCVDAAAAIGAEVFILDYGWWDIMGDWFPSPNRYPNGLDPLIDYVHKKGMLFGIYIRPEGDSPDITQSKMAKEHPDWIGPSSTINLHIPEAAAWVESEMDRLIEEHRLDLYRIDYNATFKFTETPRDGFVENNCWRYYEAFYGIHERLHQKYPKLILQQAAGGGGRNDLGTVSRFHEAYLTDGLWFPREFQVYSGLTLGLPPEIFVMLHLAHHGGRGMGMPQNLDTILRMTYASGTPQIFVGMVAPNVDELNPERQARFLHYSKIYKEFIRPLLPTCRVYHHEPINSHGGVTSSGWFAMEFGSPDRSKGWLLAAHTGPTDTDSLLLKLRGLDPGKTYRVMFDSIDLTATIDGLRLMVDGLPIKLEDVGSSELLLFEVQKQ